MHSKLTYGRFYMDDEYKAKQTQNPSDDDTPFSEPDDIAGSSNPTHPQTDTNVDEDEVYHHGLDEAINVDDPDPDDADEVELMGDSH